MIGTIDQYEHKRLCRNLSRQYSRQFSIGRKVDIYWSYDGDNYVVCKKSTKRIIKEFLTHESLSFDKILRAFQHKEYGDPLRKEMKLQEIAIKANKDKKEMEFRERTEYGAGEIYDYTVAEKRSVVVPGG